MQSRGWWGELLSQGQGPVLGWDLHLSVTTVDFSLNRKARAQEREGWAAPVGPSINSNRTGIYLRKETQFLPFCLAPAVHLIIFPACFGSFSLELAQTSLSAGFAAGVQVAFGWLCFPAVRWVGLCWQQGEHKAVGWCSLISF